MQCSRCNYEVPQGQQDCPRCRFREELHRAVPISMPPPLAPVPVAAVPMPEAAAVAFKPQPTQGKRLLTGMFSFVLPAVLLAGWYLHSKALTPTERKITTIFNAADGPCRHGMGAPCQDSINRIHALNDYPDASLLLGDYKIARYLPTLPGGNALEQRWQQNQLTEPELTAMGDVAYAKNLTVCRSFWMYAQIKRDHMAVPQLIVGGAGPMPGKP